MPIVRPSWDEYHMGFADAAAARATCDRGRSGAALVVANRQVFTGYVGAAKGLDHCDCVGHMMHTVKYADGSVREHCVRTVHAEVNAILAAAHTIVQGSILYCKMEPCPYCAMIAINAGVKRIVAQYRYHGAALSREWLAKAGVKLEVLHDVEAEYDAS